LFTWFSVFFIISFLPIISTYSEYIIKEINEREKEKKKKTMPMFIIRKDMNTHLKHVVIDRRYWISYCDKESIEFWIKTTNSINDRFPFFSYIRLLLLFDNQIHCLYLYTLQYFSLNLSLIMKKVKWNLLFDRNIRRLLRVSYTISNFFSSSNDIILTKSRWKKYFK